MSTEEPGSASARPGTAADLSRRMDRMEIAHESLAREVAVMTTTIARVELNQSHAEELHKLRYEATTAAVSGVETELKQHGDRVTTFIDRIEKVISGETSTPQARQGEALVKDYQSWRETVEARFDAAETLATQVRLLGRLAMLLVGGSVITTAVAVYAAFNHV